MMKDLKGSVALVTGGASGMGRAFADRFAAEGMNIVVADVEQVALDRAVDELRSDGADAVGIHCDVSDHESVMKLRDQASDHFGQPQLLCLNAGVAGGGAINEVTMMDWKWVLGVNLWGVIHGLDVFLPHLIDSDRGHVVITASVAGHTSYPNLAPYSASKHAVTTIAETLHHELRSLGSSVGVTCLCPGIVATNILTSSRNRPEAVTDILVEPPSDDEVAQREALIQWMAATGKSPAEVADLVLTAVRDQTFWLFTDDDYSDAIAERHRSIRERSNPLLDEPIFDI